MSRMIRITESDLRAAIRDERYWQAGHPERATFQNWVGQGFRALNPTDASVRTMVWVRAYMRDGHWVSGYWRRARPRNAHHSQYASLTLPGVTSTSDVLPVNRGASRPPIRPAPTGQARPATRAPTRWEPVRGPDGVDRVEKFRREMFANGEFDRPTRRGYDQWVRPGGAARREADLQRLDAGPPIPLGNGFTQYILPNGRIATARTSSSPGYEGTISLEIAQPHRGDFRPTDIIRYGDVVRSAP